MQPIDDFDIQEDVIDNYEAPHLYRWTETAKDCYFLGCNCSKCFLYTILGDRCKMKGSVLELVRIFGAPELTQIEEEDWEKDEEDKDCFY